MNDAPGGGTKAGTRAAIAEFRGDYSFLSNFTEAPVIYDGEHYPTVEHAFQAAKAEYDAHSTVWDPFARKPITRRWRETICRAPSASRAKAWGRQVPLRPGWEEMKVDVMRGLLDQKFAHGSTLLRLLLELTGDAVLIEGNRWHDNFWGDCRCGQEACRATGVNMLGQLLMALRASRRQELAL
jgi:ribA/ribD-fused uncharacterized protein